MMQAKKTCPRHGAGGFSLLELMLVLAILGLVVGAAVRTGNSFVRSYANIGNTVDLVQEGRQFMDQISSDLHQAGYPSAKMFDNGPDGTCGTCVYAVGLTSATQNTLTFEGDVDNSGNVSIVYLKLDVPAGGCPCTMKRGTVLKTSAGNPTYYTELTGVMNQDIFTFITNSGYETTPTDLSNVRAVRIKLQVQSTRKDIASGMYSLATLDSEAKINNFNN